MGENRPVPKKHWIKFLKAHGCEFLEINNHEKWKCPDCLRPIVFRNAPKEIPFTHIKSDLRTLGKTTEYFYEWIRTNC